MKFNFDQTIDVKKMNAYMVGAGLASLTAAGLASLTAAIFLIRDGNFPGKNIHIYEQLGVIG
ncbi:oleate hydratase [Clostridium estertheticum]|uniref:oleate hydratase n=1 Tax=Clostridium estertheticum TaxID=238834 RepID=UPI001C0B53D4|nr:oleate hydratase [Clostridium estertheticum]MBU3179316.1 oleate hydratase [Clostridium estertheticum]